MVAGGGGGGFGGGGVVGVVGGGADIGGGGPGARGSEEGEEVVHGEGARRQMFGVCLTYISPFRRRRPCGMCLTIDDPTVRPQSRLNGHLPQAFPNFFPPSSNLRLWRLPLAWSADLRLRVPASTTRY